MNTKFLKIISIFVLITLIFFLTSNVFATSIDSDEDSADTSSYDTTDAETEDLEEEENTPNNNTQYNPSYSNGNSYVTSVSSLSSTAQANLSLNNILSILLISIGILIIILAIAILIKIK